MSRSVERREFFHFRGVKFAGNEFLSEAGEAAQAFGLRAAAQKSALEIEIVDGFGELEAHVGVVGIGLRAGKFAADVGHGIAKFAESLHCFFAKVIRRRGPVIIVEKFDFAAEPREFLIERDDFEAPAAAGNHVEASVGIAIEDLLDDDGATGVHDAVAAGKDDAEFGSVTLGFAHHFLVTLFENVKRDRASGERYKLQREER